MDRKFLTTKKQQAILQFSKITPMLILLLPQLAFGAGTSLCQSQNLRDFKSFTGCGLALLTLVVPLLIGLALLLFLYGLLKYVSEGENAEERTKASQFVIFGTIGLFVMISVYGLVNILLNTFSYGGSDSGSGALFNNSGSQDVFDPYYSPNSDKTLPLPPI